MAVITQLIVMKFLAIFVAAIAASASADGQVRLLKKGQAPAPAPVSAPAPVGGTPVGVPVAVPVPVAFPVAVPVPVGPVVPQNCCEFLSQLVTLDNACASAAQQGLLALALQTFQLSQSTCRVTTDNILALQSNFIAARNNFDTFLGLITAKLTPIRQDCFAANFVPTFACKKYTQGFVEQKAFNYNSLRDLVCCSLTSVSTATAGVAVATQPIYDANILVPGTAATNTFCADTAHDWATSVANSNAAGTTGYAAATLVGYNVASKPC
jgi:hypothetical protein